MKSKTSFFNWTVLKKDITRFFPLWGLYCVILVLSYITAAPYYMDTPGRTLRYVQELQITLVALSMLFAGVCAMMLFGDQYNSRLCNALHAMPIRRECWFLTHTMAALLFFIVPNTVYAIFIAPALGAYWYLAFVLLGVSVLLFLAFFGIAAFAAMCAGSRFGMATAYVAINSWSALLWAFADVFVYPLMYGVRISNRFLLNCSPFAYAMDLEYLDIYTVYSGGTVTTFEGFIGASFGKLSILTLAGVALLGIALLLYRRRKLETAGDFMAIRPAAVVFQIFICMLTGLIFKGISDSLAVGFFGVIVGFFTGSMLLQRKVNVFKKRNFILCGAVIASLAIVLLGALLDPLNLTERVPEANQVKSVRVSEEYGKLLLEGKTPEDVELILQMHEKVVQEKPDSTIWGNIIFEYTLTGGRTMERSYPIQLSDLDQDALSAYYSNWRRVFGTDDWERFCHNATYIRIADLRDGREIVFCDNEDDYYWEQTKEMTDPMVRSEVMELLESMKAESGKVMPVISMRADVVYGDYVVNISSDGDDFFINLNLDVSEDCTTSAAQIEALFEKYYRVQYTPS